MLGFFKNAQKSIVSGDHNQVTQNIDNSSGINYTEIKQIVTDLFEQNMLRMSNEASRLINARRDTFSDQLIANLHAANPNGFKAFADPGFQYMLFTALQHYARTGDDELQDVLIDMLVKRTMTDSRDLKQIVIDEAIAVAVKISSKQLYLMGLIQLTTQQQSGFHTLDELGDYFSSVISGQEFYKTEDSVQAREEMAHLAYAGCTGSYGLADDYRSGLRVQYDYALGLHPEMLKTGMRDFLQKRFIPESDVYQIVSQAENRTFICKEDVQYAMNRLYPSGNLFENLILPAIEDKRVSQQVDKLLEKEPFDTLHKIYELYDFGGYYLTPVGKTIAITYIKLKFPSPYQSQS